MCRAALTTRQGAERSPLNGDQQSENRLWEQADVAPRIGERAINVESDYDYGSRVGVWRLLSLFEEHKMPVTCYAVGMAFEKNLSVAEAFTRNGHEIASHAYRYGIRGLLSGNQYGEDLTNYDGADG